MRATQFTISQFQYFKPQFFLHFSESIAPGREGRKLDETFIIANVGLCTYRKISLLNFFGHSAPRVRRWNFSPMEFMQFGFLSDPLRNVQPTDEFWECKRDSNVGQLARKPKRCCATETLEYWTLPHFAYIYRTGVYRLIGKNVLTFRPTCLFPVSPGIGL